MRNGGGSINKAQSIIVRRRTVSVFIFQEVIDRAIDFIDSYLFAQSSDLISYFLFFFFILRVAVEIIETMNNLKSMYLLN